MARKLFVPSYKVCRHGGGLYSVVKEVEGAKHAVYIQRIDHGSRKVYFVSAAMPLFPTLRDAILHLV